VAGAIPVWRARFALASRADGWDGCVVASVKVPDLRERAPDFALPDSTGTERTLGELVRSRRHVVIFYRGHW